MTCKKPLPQNLCFLLCKMKCSITVFIFIMACVTNVRLKKIELNGFLKQIQKVNRVFSKKVFADGKEISLNDFFKTSNASRLEIDDSGPIVEHNESEVSHLLNIVVSCEYNDAIYSFVRIVSARLEECKPKYSTKKVYDEGTLTATRNCLKTLRANLFEPMLKTMSTMILTLVGLLQHTKNFFSKKHDVIKILLSWYAFIDKGTEADPNEISSMETLKERVGSIELINHQVQSYSERFSITNCHRVQNHKDFKRTVNDYVSAASKFGTRTAGKGATAATTTADENESTDKLLKSKTDKLQPVIYHSFESLNRMRLFVFCPDGVYFNILLALIEVKSRKAEMKWNKVDMSIRTVYDTVIAKSTDIRTIHEFEKLILEKLTKIIASYVIKELNDILGSTEDPNDKQNSCNGRVRLILEKYIEIFKNLGQPSYLINNMVIINDTLWSICYNMKFTDTDITKKVSDNLNYMGLDDFVDTPEKSLDDFLLALSNTVICTRLHPATSNVFMDKMYFMPSTISEYVIDYKHLSALNARPDANARTALCTKILHLLQTLKSMDAMIVKCMDRAKQQDSKIENCFRKFNEDCVIVKNDIVDLIINGVYYCDTVEWKRILLVVRHNLDNVELFNGDVQKSMNVQRIQGLRTFTYDVKNSLEAQYSIYCYDTSNPKPGEKVNAACLTVHNVFYTKYITFRAKKKKLAAINIYRNFFQLFSWYVQKLVNDDRTVNRFKIYWDGTKKTLQNVHSIYTKTTFDAQDAYDHQLFTTKWILAVAYTRFLDIINEMICFRHQVDDRDIEYLNLIQNLF